MNLKETQKKIYQNKVDKGFNVTDINIEINKNRIYKNINGTMIKVNNN